MIVVFSFCKHDVQLARESLSWALELDGGKVPFDCVLSTDDNGMGQSVALLAENYFKSVEICYVPEWTGPTHWPIPQNKAWQNTARFMANKSRPWFWWEPDLFPVEKGWLKSIQTEYEGGMRPFMGCLVTNQQGLRYMAGCAVYPSNVSAYSSDMLLCYDVPFDIAGYREIQSQVSDGGHIIHHEVQERGNPIHFASESDLSIIREGSVCFHPCKDGSIVGVLRANQKSGVSKLFRKIFDRKKSETAYREPITLYRPGAIGDVIMVAGVAQKLHEYGYAPTIICEPVCAEVLQEHRNVKVSKSGTVHGSINLLGAYEAYSPSELKTRRVQDIFAETVFKAMGDKIPHESTNLTPILTITDHERKSALSRLSEFQKPWIAVCPKSNAWPNRTVSSSVWSKIPSLFPGPSWLWTGTDQAPSGYVDLKLKKIRDLMGIIAVSDLAVSVDSGPAHIAAGLGTLMLSITQSVDLRFRLGDQTDWQSIGSALDCLNCNEKLCPINPQTPPCGMISSELLVSAITQRLRTVNSSDVSVVIPVYNPNISRLQRCLDSVLPQVSEVVISSDGSSAPPIARDDGRVKTVSHFHRKRVGFGRTCNLGARNTNGKYILILNDDCFLSSDAVSKMVSVMTDERVGVVGCLLRYPDGSINHGGTSRRPGDVGWGHLDFMGFNPTISSPKEMENVTFAAALLRRKAFYSIRGFDEDYDMYFEDHDVNLRLRQNGWKVMYQPNAVGIHEESQTTSPIKKDLSDASRKVFHKKWKWYFEKNRNNTFGTF